MKNNDKPVIGITARVEKDQMYSLDPVYGQAILQSGGLPLIVPIVDQEDIPVLCERLDGLIVTGGGDINPLLYGEEPHVRLGAVYPGSDEYEKELILNFLKLDKPFIGMCRGLQMLNISLGGTNYQDLEAQYEGDLNQHKQLAMRTHRTHSVELEDDSKLLGIMGEKKFNVNSFHHQGVKDVSSQLKVAARAADGLVEALESDSYQFVMGIQWHPEEFAVQGDEASKKLFDRFVKECTKDMGQNQ
ncbi:gamma-glutamyl-gamma-aminobutyrate hydrolase family protein [Planococcus shenhongbingii]|uniref:Gamma-glutamyl-gamma-aminobutyrate hydrolase family protein n=1 Tax=Planococcus shenhongbingii TaxID=3058398 RepID=A0ABT8N9W2_9BACL|nr:MULTISPECIES: gamma-glutamyl-gamma-aminobutyrate hydrolase family protein [unclassified Planococcus (in: firmicutes)]MDN7244462.1 gamma-glutamyl-gamma-aminobutyrate hydrolase family protein [Planococcus sp. N017]WKA57623.1 gamma-glutamyl-gamma-aminobutyrate hydrolase family protein [Planococcus sp. N016]